MFGKNFILYYEDKPVAKIEYEIDFLNGQSKTTGKMVHNFAKDEPMGFFVKNIKIYNEELMPEIYKTNVSCSKNILLGMFNHWLNAERSIPNGRLLIKNALSNLSIKSVPELVERSMGMSLTDRYWYGNSKHCGQLWKEVNFYEHPFSTDVGEFLTGNYFCKDTSKINFNDPSITTNGRQDKMWLLSNGVPVLRKLDTVIPTSNEIMYESINEIIASEVAKILHLPHVHYEIDKTSKRKACLCPSFISKNEEYVSCSNFIKNECVDDLNINAFKKIATDYCGISTYDFYEYISKTSALICIMLNSDVNTGNVGFVVTKNNGLITTARFAPAFDYGNSMGLYDYANETLWNKSFNNLKDEFILRTNVFGKTYEEISYKIGKLDDVNLDELKELPSFVKNICSVSNIDNQVSRKLVELFSASVDNFIKIVEINRNPQIDLDKFIESYDTKEEGHIEENEIEDLR